jgi:hypothetical protein
MLTVVVPVVFSCRFNRGVFLLRLYGIADRETLAGRFLSTISAACRSGGIRPFPRLAKHGLI